MSPWQHSLYKGFKYIQCTTIKQGNALMSFVESTVSCKKLAVTIATVSQGTVFF